MALQLRRGTNAERLSMTPVIGELIYVTDYELVTLSVTAIDAGTDTLTSVAHGLAVDQQIKFQDANLNGLVLNQVYFVKAVPSSDTFTLSLTSGGGIVDITGTYTIPLVFAKTPTNAAGAPLGTNSTPLWVGDGVTVGGIVAAALNLDDLLDVDITSLAEGNTFYYDATTGFWRNTNIINVNDATNNVTLLGDLAVNGGDITTTQTTGNLFNATATTVNIGNGANTELNLGSPTGGSKVVIKPETIVGISTTQNVFDTVATTVNAFGAATAVTIGAPTGTTTIDNDTVINGTGYVESNLTVNNGTVLTNSGNVLLFDTTATTVDAFGAATAINMGAATGTTTINNNAVVTGDLTVTGADIGTGADNVRLQVNRTVASGDPQNAFKRSLLIRAVSAGTPAIGYGPALGFVGQTTATSSGNFEEAGAIAVTATDLTPGTEAFKMTFNLMHAGAQDQMVMQLDSTGNLQIDNDLAVNGGDITTTQAVASLFNTTATTINLGNGANTELNLGSPTGGSKVVVKSENLVGLATTQNVFNTVATTVNAFGASTATAIGSTASGTTTIGWDAVVNKDLAVNGGDITTTQTTGNLFNTTATTVNIGGAATTMSVGNAAGTVTIPGNLTVNGTTTNINTTNLLVEDKNVTIGDVTTPTDVTAAGGGITLLGATNKTITWNNATDGWEFNQPIKVTGDIVTSGNLTVNDIDADSISFPRTGAFATLKTQTTTTTSTSPTSISSSTNISQKVVIKIIDNVSGEIHVLEALAFRKGSTAYLTTYAEMYTLAALATFTADVSGGTTRILATPASANSTTFNVVRLALD